MNKKYILIAALVVFGALIVSAFGWAARSKAVTSLTPAEVMALRWNAMARYYEAKSAQTVDSASLTPAEIMALRWNAMAKYYEAQGSQISAAVKYGPPGR